MTVSLTSLWNFYTIKIRTSKAPPGPAAAQYAAYSTEMREIMFGSWLGNLCGISYFMAFQILGILICLSFFCKKETTAVSVLMGSVLGSFSLQWLPVVFAFFLDFSLAAHLLALVSMCVITWFVCQKTSTKIKEIRITWNPKKILCDNPVLVVLIPLFIFTAIVLLHHTLSSVDGAMHCGQSTFGDMNMHLGFITSVAVQKTFPPEYSILPGTKLAYPFLSDSISSSVYLFGASLRTAYLLPVFFALLQIFFGIYVLAKNLLSGIGSSGRAKSILAFALFFFNGGFGFFYFISNGFTDNNFTRIFTEFYQTPTNLVTENIQWHNIICDMLIPQRATLFGWAVLFPVLYLLQRGRKTKERMYFVTAGILSGGLVLIHTHSFLALGILCCGFLLLDLQKNSTEFPLWIRLCLMVLFLGAMSWIRYNQCSANPFEANIILAIGFAVIGVFLGVLIYYLAKNFSKETVSTWGIFLGIVLLFALPQLFGFTFQQAQGEQFVRGSFNWANSTEIGDSYILFYLKNLGIMFILPLLIFVFGSKKQRQIMFPAAFLWVICEFILFQPNPYDNNKLLLVAYAFFCIAAADFIWETFPELFRKPLQKPICAAAVSVVAVLGCFSAVLTMGREYVSDYELYSSAYVSLAKWVEKSTAADDIFLTDTNHNNAVASLTGRSIVCGSGSFLYYHGVDYRQAEYDVAEMYQNPSRRDELLNSYEVSYVVLGPNETGKYSIPDLQEWIERSDVVYNNDGILVLSV